MKGSLKKEDFEKFGFLNDVSLSFKGMDDNLQVYDFSATVGGVGYQSGIRQKYPETRFDPAEYEGYDESSDVTFSGELYFYDGRTAKDSCYIKLDGVMYVQETGHESPFEGEWDEGSFIECVEAMARGMANYAETNIQDTLGSDAYLESFSDEVSSVLKDVLTENLAEAGNKLKKIIDKRVSKHMGVKK